jgi:hypothetical protein
VAPDDAAPTVDGFVGVYDADGGLLGELAYVVGRARGTAHCALCDITHGRFRRRRAWDELVGRLGVPFDLVHRDERSPEVARASGDDLPCVLVREGRDVSVLLGPADLEAAGGSVGTFASALERAAERRRLRWPGRAGRPERSP